MRNYVQKEQINHLSQRIRPFTSCFKKIPGTTPTYQRIPLTIRGNNSYAYKTSVRSSYETRALENLYNMQPIGELNEFGHNRSIKTNTLFLTLTMRTRMIHALKQFSILDSNYQSWIELPSRTRKLLAHLKRKYGIVDYMLSYEAQSNGSCHCHIILVFPTMLDCQVSYDSTHDTHERKAVYRVDSKIKTHIEDYYNSDYDSYTPHNKLSNNLAERNAQVEENRLIKDNIDLQGCYALDNLASYITKEMGKQNRSCENILRKYESNKDYELSDFEQKIISTFYYSSINGTKKLSQTSYHLLQLVRKLQEEDIDNSDDRIEAIEKKIYSKKTTEEKKKTLATELKKFQSKISYLKNEKRRRAERKAKSSEQSPCYNISNNSNIFDDKEEKAVIKFISNSELKSKSHTKYGIVTNAQDIEALDKLFKPIENKELKGLTPMHYELLASRKVTPTQIAELKKLPDVVQVQAFKEFIKLFSHSNTKKASKKKVANKINSTDSLDVLKYEQKTRLHIDDSHSLEAYRRTMYKKFNYSKEVKEAFEKRNGKIFFMTLTEHKTFGDYSSYTYWYRTDYELMTAYADIKKRREKLGTLGELETLELGQTAIEIGLI